MSSSDRRTPRCVALGLLAALMTTLIGSQRAAAGDLLFLRTHPGKEESVAIGEVLSISQSQIVFEPKRVLAGRDVPNKVTITDYDPELVKTLSQGDAAVLSIARIGRRKGYKLSDAAVEVSSSDPAEANVLTTGFFIGSNLVAYNWFINSCGKEADFVFHYSDAVDTAYVKRAEERVAIAQRTEDEPGDIWTVVAEPPTCEPIQPMSWWRQLLRKLAATFWDVRTPKIF